jgi:hypothetical protein
MTSIEKRANSKYFMGLMIMLCQSIVIVQFNHIFTFTCSAKILIDLLCL